MHCAAVEPCPPAALRTQAPCRAPGVPPAVSRSSLSCEWGCTSRVAGLDRAASFASRGLPSMYMCGACARCRDLMENRLTGMLPPSWANATAFQQLAELCVAKQGCGRPHSTPSNIYLLCIQDACRVDSLPRCRVQEPGGKCAERQSARRVGVHPRSLPPAAHRVSWGCTTRAREHACVCLCLLAWKSP